MMDCVEEPTQDPLRSDQTPSPARVEPKVENKKKANRVRLWRDDRSLVVRITHAFSENEKVEFTVHTKTTLPVFQKTQFSVVRQHEEFVWLHDRLEENEKYANYGIPPVPSRPNIHALCAKLQRIDVSLKDEFLATIRKTVAMHEVFLQQLAGDPVFQVDSHLRAFLENKEEVLCAKPQGIMEFIIELITKFLHCESVQTPSPARVEPEVENKKKANTVDLWVDDRSLLVCRGGVGEGKVEYENSKKVNITHALSENEKVEFTVHTKTALPEFQKSQFSVVRQHAEFVWLHDRYEENEKYAGYAIPPVPPRPDIDAPWAKLQRLVGSLPQKKSLKEMEKCMADCIQSSLTTNSESLALLETTVVMHWAFLQQLAADPVFQADSHLRVFLENDVKDLCAKPQDCVEEPTQDPLRSDQTPSPARVEPEVENKKKANEVHMWHDDHSLSVDIKPVFMEYDYLNVQFTVHTDTTRPEFQKSQFSVVRQHEEFVWLHDRYEENEKYAGYAIPPVPPRQDFAAREQLFNEAKESLTQEELQKMCEELNDELVDILIKMTAMYEVFLMRLATDPVLKTDSHLRVFLDNEEKDLCAKPPGANNNK